MTSRAGASGSRGSASGSLRNSLADKNGAPLEECTTEELLPCPDPEPELRRAMSSLVTASTAKPTDMDWQAQYDGLISMRRLTVHHSQLVIPQLHQFTLALIPAIDSLRSSIAKVAMALVREMTRFLDPKAMDNELDYLVPVLAKKSGENTWLGGEADDALGDFARTLTDARVLAALIPQAKHKNPTVRLRVAWHVEYVCANAGAKTFVGSAANRDLLEKTFSALVPLLEEGAAETRAMCKRALCHLHGVVTPGDFEKLLKKLSSEAKIKSVRAVIEKGPPPLPTTSDGGRWTPRGKTPGSNSSRGNSPASSVRPGELLSQHGFGVRRAKSMPVGVAVTNPDVATPRTPEDARGGRLLLDALAPALAKLRSKDWKERGEGIDELESIAVRVPPGSFTESAVAALFDAVLPRLNDGNAKVSARASLALAAVLPAVGDDAAPTLPTLVPARSPRASDPPTIRSDRPPRTPRMRSSRTSPRRCWCNTWRTAPRTAPRGEAHAHRVPGHPRRGCVPDAAAIGAETRAAGGDGDADEREGTGDARGEREAAEGVGAVRRERGAVESRRGEICADEGQAGGRAQEQGTLREG